MLNGKFFQVHNLEQAVEYFNRENEEQALDLEKIMQRLSREDSLHLVVQSLLSCPALEYAPYGIKLIFPHGLTLKGKEVEQLTHDLWTTRSATTTLFNDQKLFELPLLFDISPDALFTISKLAVNHGQVIITGELHQGEIFYLSFMERNYGISLDDTSQVTMNKVQERLNNSIKQYSMERIEAFNYLFFCLSILTLFLISLK